MDLCMASANCVNCGRKIRSSVPVRPLRCLATTAYGFPALAIVATRLNWLSYQFELLPTVSQMTYAWDFGDGVAVTADNPEHKFSGSGEHLVKLVISDATGEVWNVEKTVTISFWSWENGLVKGIVFGLIGSIILCVYIAFHLYRKKIPEVEG